MTKHSTNYFNWTFLLLINCLVLSVSCLIIYKGLLYDKKYTFDTIGHMLLLVGLIIFGLSVWETIVLFSFISNDVNGAILIDNEKLIIIKGSNERGYNLKNLTELQFVNGVYGTRYITSHLTYSKLTFEDKTVIILTSFTIYNHELVKFLGNKAVRAVTRDRKFFELIE